MSKVEIPDCPIQNKDDFTFYAVRRTGDKIITAATECGENGAEPSLNFSCALKDSDPGKRIEEARLMAASCFKGKRWSVTARSESSRRTFNDDNQPRDKADQPTSLKAIGCASPNTYPKNNTLFSLNDICELLREQLFPDESSPRTGAVIVTGATASAKSQITRGLVNKHLEWCVKNSPKRKPHLVTVEDPIESWFLDVPDERDEGDFATTWPIDYTPRELRNDVTSVQQALLDALRQSPAAVFISEIRNDDGWRDLIEFAGTGHLIFATGHAGSLTEAMGKILKAHEVRTAADRAMIAERILGLIHLKLEIVGTNTAALMVALWRRGSGKQAFISDGLSALAPQAEMKNMSSFGRLWFAKTLLSRDTSRPVIENLRTELKENVYLRARELDLEGR
jgi:hypothetical protein